MAKTYCPECDAVITVDKPADGALITCPECGIDLEIVSAEPFEVDYPYDDDWDDDADDDWDDDDDDDDDGIEEDDDY
ncbi:MAG: hypothetical protein GX620_09080 [Chloroflexi bacterium]|nr:hypothetical protein [Chloroflexota bacterium]